MSSTSISEEAPKSTTSTFTSRLFNALRPKASRKKLRKDPPSDHQGSTRSISQGRANGSRQDHGFDHSFSYAVDEQTGERRDDTALLHGLAHHGSFDTINEAYYGDESSRPPGEPILASLSVRLWSLIVEYLSPCDAANLALSNKTLLQRVGRDPWYALDRPENHQYKIEFLVSMDRHLPDHLLCFPCATYHVRTQRGEERLKATHILNPLFVCPNALTQVPPRTRIAFGHTLPFSFVQLVVRADRYSSRHGIPLEAISRRWKDTQGTWSHQTRFHIDKGHLLMRVVSQTFAEPDLPLSAQRNLLYSREDYFPYFSVCDHWRDGELMNICKCALNHIPKRRVGLATQLQSGPKVQLSLINQSQMASQCSQCQPMRRCPRCLTEYLVELKFREDKSDPVNRFKQALTVTRWSDLGDGTSPLSPEWAACNGDLDAYDSFDTIKGRAISGTFESQFGVTLPGQRILSLNPRNERRGEDGNNWY